MAKTPKRPKAVRIKRNPLAKALRTAKFRPRVVERPGTYKRRPKHPGEVDSEE
ncbi:MAG TPA: hypothetical protein VHA70_14535 [Bauldia sp.]|nr:hypothetical protein [Bauldia sp.]